MSEMGYREKCLQQQINACYVCGENDDLRVHHINGDRSDNRLENLIPLCRSCHGKVHTKKTQGPVIDSLSEELPEGSYLDTARKEGEDGNKAVIPIASDTRDKLRAEKVGNETYSEVIERLLNRPEPKRRELDNE